MPGKDQYNPTLPRYHAWVVEKLVGIVANDATSALKWMVAQWIKDNEEWLEKKHILYDDFHREFIASGPKAVVEPMSRKGNDQKKSTVNEKITNSAETK